MNERYSNQPTRLHCNETPFDLPIKLKEQLATKMVQMDWNRYPDFYNTELTKIVAQNIGFRSENILLGNGSSQLIQQIVNGAATFFLALS
ncbi:MAG: hypothetical protein R2822_21835 [Spirosomataceae bacterium]